MESLLPADAVQVIPILQSDSQSDLELLLSGYSSLDLLVPRFPQISPFLSNFPYLVDAAAYYGALSCFRYLLALQPDMSHTDRHNVLFSLLGHRLILLHMAETWQFYIYFQK
jgi:hypothetical protein